jgi:hypothetical protein
MYLECSPLTRHDHTQDIVIAFGTLLRDIAKGFF